MVSVIVLFPKMEEARSIRNLLVRSGIDVTSVCTTGAQVIYALDDLEDGIVVRGYKYADMMYSELYDYMPKTFKMLLVASQMNCMNVMIDKIDTIAMPLKAQELVSRVNDTLDELWIEHKKRRQKPRVRESKDKQIIIDAKVKLMEEKGYTENDAHKYLQKKSMDNGTNMVETAKMVLELFTV